MNDEPTIITLYDTVFVLAKRNADWLTDTFCNKIFAWQSSLFLESHVEEVCKEKCPGLLSLCVEYREHGTIFGVELPPLFGLVAYDYVQYNQPELKPEHIIFGSSPVRNAYFKMDVAE